MLTYPDSGGIYLRDPVTGDLTPIDTAEPFIPPCQAEAPPAPVMDPEPAATPKKRG